MAGLGANMLPVGNILKLCREFQRNETFNISPPSNCQAAGLEIWKERRRPGSSGKRIECSQLLTLVSLPTVRRGH